MRLGSIGALFRIWQMLGTSIQLARLKNGWCTFFSHQTICLVAICLQDVSSHHTAVDKMFTKCFFFAPQVDVSPHLVSPPIWRPELTAPWLAAIFEWTVCEEGKILGGRIQKRTVQRYLVCFYNAGCTTHAITFLRTCNHHVQSQINATRGSVTVPFCSVMAK